MKQDFESEAFDGTDTEEVQRETTVASDKAEPSLKIDSEIFNKVNSEIHVEEPTISAKMEPESS